MASSSSSSSSPAAETHIPQCGSGINVANFESSKLRRDGSWNNYKSWKEQMLCLVESQGLLEFIDGVAPPPQSKDGVDYVAWRQTDRLVKGWILGALSDEVVQNVIHLDSARDVWLDLENQFSTAQSQQGNLYHPPPPPPSNDTPTPPITNPGATPPPPPEYNYAPPPPPSSYPAAPPPLTGKPGSYPVGPQLNYQLPQDPQQDIALDLVNKYPYLARINNSNSSSALNVIASKDTSFLVEAQLNLWERFVYSCIRLEMESFDTLENSPRWREMVRELHSTLSKVISQLVPGVKKIYEKKLMREQARRLVKCICKHMESLNHEEASSIYRNAMRTAAKSGSHEVVEEIVATFPPAIHSQDDDTNENFLHLAVRNRCEKVFNLLYQATNHRCHYCSLSDTSGNSILHMAAFLAPPHKLNLVSGAALQMQREIQWFKEVHKFASPFIKGRKNKAGKTPEMIFTEAHKKLKEEGEKWMKDTANSCTIAAALIVTVVFAAAITVPGGNESDTGYPMMWENSAFTIFAVSDAVSLFTSATSLLMFLSILTSRYAEQDFLYALPKRLCIGLVTLFLSILFMMAAFSSTLYLVFGRKKAWVLIPVAALTCLPISSFVLLQFPLLIAVISSTYGKGIFGKQSNRPFH